MASLFDLTGRSALVSDVDAASYITGQVLPVNGGMVM